ncbi:MAG TPA: hypothetical protein VMS73_07040, partial [Anaerolineaceae bacterium]|nr:hypothetical protein [Anaerolineaceae bacterium]
MKSDTHNSAGYVISRDSATSQKEKMQLKKRGEATQEEKGCDYSVTARQPQERDTNTREKSK